MRDPDGVPLLQADTEDVPDTKGVFDSRTVTDDEDTDEGETDPESLGDDVAVGERVFRSDIVPVLEAVGDCFAVNEGVVVLDFETTELTEDEAVGLDVAELQAETDDEVVGVFERFSRFDGELLDEADGVLDSRTETDDDFD